MSQDIATLGLRVDASQVREGDRALEGLERRAGSTEQATGKLAKSTDLLNRIYRDLAAALAAVKLYEYVKDAALLNARYETLGAVMGVVGRQAGYTAAQMEATAVALQKTGISMVESRQQATRLVQAHIDLAYASKLARIAQDAAVIGNMNSSDAFAALVHGIQSGQTEVLRTIGLNISMEQSYKTIAAELHKNVNQLSQNEKTQGVLNAVIAAGADINGVYAASMDTAGKQLLSMKRYTEDLKVMQGEVFNEVLTTAVMAYTQHLKDANGEISAMAQNGELKAWGQDLARIFVSVANAVDNTVTGVKMIGVWLAHQSAGGDINKKFDLMQAHAPKKATLGGAVEQAAMIERERAKAFEAEAKLFDETMTQMAGSFDRFDKAFDDRQAARAAKDAAALKATVDKEKQLQNIMVFYAQQREKGLVSEKKYLADVAAAMKAFTGDNHHYNDVAATDNKAATAAAKAESEYKKLIETIKEKIAVANLDAETQARLTDGQKMQATVLTEIANGTRKLTDAQKGAVKGLLEELVWRERITAAQDADVKAKKAFEDATAREVTAIWDKVRAMRQEVEMFGLSEVATLNLERIRLQAVINGAARLELSDAEISKYEQMLAAINELAKATGELDAKKTFKKEAEEARAAWQKTTDYMEQALTNALMNGFNNGKPFAQNLRDTVVAMFSTMVIRPGVQAVGQAGASMASAAMQAAVSGGGGIGSMLGAAGSAGTLYNAFTSSTLGQFVSGFSGSAGAAAEALGAPMTAAAQAGSYANMAMPYLGAAAGGLAGYNVGERVGGVGGAVAGTLAGAGTVAVGGMVTGALAGTGMMAGATQALAALGPWGWAAIAGLAIIGSMQDGPEAHTRMTFASNNAPGNISINERGNEGRNDAYIGSAHRDSALGSFGVVSSFWAQDQSATVAAFLDTVAKTDDALAGFMTATEKAATIAALSDLRTVANAGAEGTDPNALGGLDKVFQARINTILTSVEPALAALLDGFAGTSQQLAIEATALLDYRKNLPAASEALFGAAVTLQDLAALRTPTELVSAAIVRVTTAFDGTNRALTVLGVSAETAFGQLGLSSLSARQRLIDLAGGVDTLNAGTAYFAQNFLPEADRMAPILAAVTTRMTDLGFAGVATADGYKNAVMGLVNSGALATAEGAKTYVELLKMAEAFKYVGDASKAAEEASAAAAKAAEQAAQDLADALLGNVDKALSIVEKVAEAEKSRRQQAHDAEMAALAERITATTTGLEKTRALSAALAGTLGQMATPDRGAAQAQVKAALAIARAGGPLPDADSLSGALSTLAQDASGMFSTLADFQRDQFRTANDLADLGGLSGAQATAQQQLLDALNAQSDAAKVAYEAEVARLDSVVAAAQRQVELLTNVDTSMTTMAEALGGFVDAWSAARLNNTVAAGIPAPLSSTSSNLGSAAAGSVQGSDLAAEVRAMRQELTSGLMTIARHTKKTGDTLDQFNRDGMPAEREA